jgi:threonyl-tRNA synthetase
MVVVKNPTGESIEVEGASTAKEALEKASCLIPEIVAVRIDGELSDLASPVGPGSFVEPVVTDEPDGLHILRHSAAHILAQAVLDLFPEAKYAIGPPTEDGFYYDFDVEKPFTAEDLEAIEQKMKTIVEADQPFVREELDKAEALKLFANQPYKVEIIEGVDESEGAAENAVSVYHNPPAFVDLCRGPHVPSTSYVRHFKLMRVAGAYWRGDARNRQLQRIYGTCWPTQEQLEQHLHRLAEAQKRDHRKLGVALDLFSFPDELGSGLAIWHPKGARVRKVLEDFSRAEHEAAGYQFVYTPHVARSVLWETSGHLGYFKDLMFPPMELEGIPYYLKPMNCPFHILVYKSRTRSYREFPLRLFELGTVYRLEPSGVVHGLLRARGFTQDDSHIFCTPEQLGSEIHGLIEFVRRVIATFGFTEFSATLSTKPEGKAIGSDEVWDNATAALARALGDSGMAYEVDEGGGAFYGPKIDIHVNDAIGRRWQLSTIQVDFNLPERFDLEYMGEDNKRHRPIMIHRAMFGSVERFFGILVEHYAGAFPVWLAPVQLVVMPVADRHVQYAQAVASRAQSRGIRCEVDNSRETLQNKIRRSQLEKVPYVAVVGDADVEKETCGLRSRDGSDRRGVPVEEALDEIVRAIEERTL